MRRIGEILRTEDKAAYGCINSKRVDLLIVDADCKLLHAIEGAATSGAPTIGARSLSGGQASTTMTRETQ